MAAEILTARRFFSQRLLLVCGQCTDGLWVPADTVEISLINSGLSAKLNEAYTDTVAQRLCVPAAQLNGLTASVKGCTIDRDFQVLICTSPWKQA